jgi:hypothetical protein
VIDNYGIRREKFITRFLRKTTQFQAIEAVFFVLDCFRLLLIALVFVGFNLRVKPKTNMNATVNVLCYRSKTLSNGEHPLMLRICKSGKKKYQSLKISVNPKNWDFEKEKPKRNCPNREFIESVISTNL